jgi:hypothetical protein
MVEEAYCIQQWILSFHSMSWGCLALCSLNRLGLPFWQVSRFNICLCILPSSEGSDAAVKAVNVTLVFVVTDDTCKQIIHNKAKRKFRVGATFTLMGVIVLMNSVVHTLHVLFVNFNK